VGLPFDGSHVAISITNPSDFPRACESLTCGVPLPKGFARDAKSLCLLGPGGEPVPVQVQVTEKRADGTPRWVLLDFESSLEAHASAVYRVAQGTPARAATARMSCELRDGVATVETGAADFRVDTRRFRLFDAVRVQGVELIRSDGESWGLLLEDATGQRYAADATPAQAEFEETGPVRTVLCVRGQFGTGDSLLARFVCRLHFYAGKAEVRVFLTLHNPRAHNHPGNIWDLGSGGSLFLEDFSICLPVLATDAGRAAVPHGPQVHRGAAAMLYQDSSGGENWPH
jgi:hypothetical protein